MDGELCLVSRVYQTFKIILATRTIRYQIVIALVGVLLAQTKCLLVPGKLASTFGELWCSESNINCWGFAFLSMLTNTMAWIFFFYTGGKSAIVTGLVVGLGGNAATASRGNRGRSFVKTGKQWVPSFEEVALMTGTSQRNFINGFWIKEICSPITL